MNILYDGPFEPQPKGGVVRYFHQIADKLERHHRIGFTRRAAITGPRNFLELPPFAHFRPHRVSFFIDKNFLTVAFFLMQELCFLST